ncbi:GHKL domain-containing protein [Pseudomonas sp. PB120]|uniref:ATP-binding protein n=1 Tax=Pseudomonas sp. PB120 TaxID=2494700 RepID=UPI0012FD93AD|nr:ATP-binding protein [Pseudomonas sp. PB120]MVV50416.1 GHKL domain-containing protein [Pseudomonas sp. PB120]
MDGFKKRLKDSVQLRLSVTLSLAILIVAVVAGVFAFISALDEAHEMQDETLRQVAVLFDRQQMNLHYPAAEKIDDDNEESRVIVQYLADGSKAVGNDDALLPLPFPTTLADGLSTLNVTGEDFRVLVRTTARGERIVVAQETGVRDKEARESAWRSLLPFLILFPVLLLVVGDLVRKLFRPIAALSADIDRRDEQSLHPVDERDLPTEIRPFVVAINRLLARVAQSMENQRRFVADAAHELRSPMTALSLQAERLSATDMPAPARERLLPLSRGIERSRNLIDQLLTLAAAQSSSNRPPTRVSVHDVYRRVLEDLLPLAECKNIDIGVESTKDVQVLINEMDLMMLVKNLVDNAIRYTPQGGRIDLLVERTQGNAILQIKDTGPGITIEEQARVFDPFYRSLGTDEAGSGLGLSIVKAIADRAGVSVHLSFSDETNQSGLCVSLQLTGADVCSPSPR